MLESEEQLEDQKQTVHNLSQVLNAMQEKYETDKKKYVIKIKKSNQSLSELQEKNKCLEASVRIYRKKIMKLKAVISERKNVENIENICDLITNLSKSVSNVSVGTQTQPECLENKTNEGTSEHTNENSMEICNSTTISEVQNLQHFEYTSKNFFLPLEEVLYVFGPMCQWLFQLESDFNVKIKVKSVLCDFPKYLVVITGQNTCIENAKTFILRKSYDFNMNRVSVLNQERNLYMFESQVVQKFRCNTSSAFSTMQFKAIRIANESGAEVHFYPSYCNNFYFVTVRGILSKFKYAVRLLFATFRELQPIGNIKNAADSPKKLCKRQLKELKRLQNNSITNRTLRCQKTKENQNNNQKQKNNQNNRKQKNQNNQKQKNNNVQKLTKIESVPEKPKPELRSQTNRCIIEVPLNGLHVPPDLLMHKMPKTPTANNGEHNDAYVSPENIPKPKQEVIVLE